MAMPRSEFLNQKRDYSDYVIHLTRSAGAVHAKDVLTSILRSRNIEARSPHFIFKHWITDQVPADRQSRFNVVCLTECPVEFIDQLVTEVAGRSVTLEPYGICIEKVYVRRFGGPAFYVTESNHQAYRHLWNHLRDAKRWDLLAEVMPYVNTLSDLYDFHWEREWRVPGGLPLDPNKVLFILCPQEHIQDLRETVNADEAFVMWRRVPIVDARWRPERLVEELIKQLR